MRRATDAAGDSRLGTLINVDTSAIVALIVKEPASAAVAAWYTGTRGVLVSAAWCVTEFASALGLKTHRAELDTKQALRAWARFEAMTANDLQLLPVESGDLHRAAQMTLDTASGLRAGDALHLACAERAGAGSIVTLDHNMAINARGLRIKPVALPTT